MNYESFLVEIEAGVAQVTINRAEKANSLHLTAWEEMRSIFHSLNDNADVRVVILKGAGKHFCAGIDLETLMDIQRFGDIKCEGRRREKLRKFILNLQSCITAIEDCRKPVIAAIHKACIGGAVDIVSACDMRFCTQDAQFSIKEIDLGLVADIGTLQRLPNILNPGIVADMAYTGRKVGGQEAEKIGLVNRAFENQESMMESVIGTAATIASKSPLCIRGTKETLLYQRDHSVADALNYIATWNAAMLMSDDIMEAMQANMMKRAAEFQG